MTVVLGAHDLRKKEKNQQRIKVAKFCPHSSFSGKFDFDIMLLRVSKLLKIHFCTFIFKNSPHIKWRLYILKLISCTKKNKFLFNTLVVCGCFKHPLGFLLTDFLFFCIILKPNLENLTELIIFTILFYSYKIMPQRISTWSLWTCPRKPKASLTNSIVLLLAGEKLDPVSLIRMFWKKGQKRLCPSLTVKKFGETISNHSKWFAPHLTRRMEEYVR